MNKKQTYQTPVVLKEVSVLLERDFLEASLVEDAFLVTSEGMDSVDIDSSSSDFDWNNSWEWENN